jgi:hypothetical protein
MLSRDLSSTNRVPDESGLELLSPQAEQAISTAGDVVAAHKQWTELRSDRNGRNLRRAMIGVLETAASYGSKSALVLDKPVHKHGSEAADR